MKGEKTKVTRANSKSYSLRTTVPKGISGHLELKEGDAVLWTLRPDTDKKGDFVAILKRLNAEKKK
ncbi:MAG TPA: AbrB family transcriptional regulator [archaeon]|nr:AbrB family transcriptional regulator [archaeon]